jgi:hypothetical protein
MRAGRWLMTAVIWWLLVNGEAKTRFRGTGRARLFGLRRRLLPDVREGGGWSRRGGDVLRVLDVGLDFL